MTTATAVASDETPLAVEHDHISPAGVDLHYVAAGPTDGDLVVCLHGFPEFWYCWKEQIPALADAGYRVVAPDMRGANRSAKPAARSAYAPGELAADLAGVIEQFDGSSARVVGHDFGGLVAWHLAAEQPDIVDRLAILNSPNLAVYHRHLWSSVSQLWKSWYIFFFQLPRLPEYALSRDDYAAFDEMYEDSIDAGAITEADLRRFKDAAARDGALHAMVNWYRATRQWYLGRVRRRTGFSDRAVSVPTLLCWGEQDEALSVDLVEDHHDVVEDLRIERYPEASHWVQFDAAERVNERLLAFL